jgi:hypothetical protein
MRVMIACQADYVRFCPMRPDMLINPQEEIMCLRYFKSNLSLGCRQAANAATQNATAQ